MATKLTPLGSQQQVNQSLGGGVGINFSQEFPDAAALTDGRFAVVYGSWFDGSGTDTDIHAHIVNADGTPSGGGILVTGPTGQQLDASVAARADGGFTTVWTDYTTSASPDICFAITNAVGVVTTSRTVLMDSAFFSNFGLGSSDIATMSDGRQIVVAEGSNEIWF